MKTGLKLAQAKYSFGCAFNQDSFYVVGGKINEKAMNTCERYKLEGKELISQKIAPLQQAREDLGCCMGFDNCVYALGGVTSTNDATASVERYSLKSGAWETIKPMKYPRFNFAVVATPRGLFVLGGHTHKKYLKEVEFYDYE